MPFTDEERAEIDHVVARYRAVHAHGKVTIELNFNDGHLPVVTVQGRRFQREDEVQKIEEAKRRAEARRRNSLTSAGR